VADAPARQCRLGRREGFDKFGITPTPLAAVAPDWLVRFRRHGRFGQLGEGRLTRLLPDGAGA
jgi:hypothetical protein